MPLKVVSEWLGHATPAFTIDTDQHVLPGMQADAARVFEQFIASATRRSPVEAPEDDRLKTVEALVSQPG